LGLLLAYPFSEALVLTRPLWQWGQIFTTIYWFGFSASLFTALQMIFLLYLFEQHMVD
jgi:hypothetical protein